MLKAYFQTELIIEQINIVDHVGRAFYSFDLGHYLYSATGLVTFLGDILLTHFFKRRIRSTPF